jgi:hypothetical protein
MHKVYILTFYSLWSILLLFSNLSQVSSSLQVSRLKICMHFSYMLHSPPVISLSFYRSNINIWRVRVWSPPLSLRTLFYYSLLLGSNILSRTLFLKAFSLFSVHKVRDQVSHSHLPIPRSSGFVTIPHINGVAPQETKTVCISYFLCQASLCPVFQAFVFSWFEITLDCFLHHFVIQSYTHGILKSTCKSGPLWDLDICGWSGEPSFADTTISEDSWLPPVLRQCRHKLQQIWWELCGGLIICYFIIAHFWIGSKL